MLVVLGHSVAVLVEPMDVGVYLHALVARFNHAMRVPLFELSKTLRCTTIMFWLIRLYYGNLVKYEPKKP